MIQQTDAHPLTTVPNNSANTPAKKTDAPANPVPNASTTPPANNVQTTQAVVFYGTTSDVGTTENTKPSPQGAPVHVDVTA